MIRASEANSIFPMNLFPSQARLPMKHETITGLVHGNLYCIQLSVSNWPINVNTQPFVVNSAHFTV